MTRLDLFAGPGPALPPSARGDREVARIQQVAPKGIAVPGLVRVLSVVLVTMAFGAAAAERRSLTREEAVRLALDNNPEIQSLAGDVEAAQARVRGAEPLLRNNPQVTGYLGPRTSPAGRSLDTNLQITQQIEIAGQRGARLDVASAGLEATEARMQALRVEIVARVRQAFGAALAAQQRRQLAEEALELARQGVRAAEERFGAGAAALLEVNTARVELGRSTRQRADAERSRQEAVGRLRLLTGLDPLQPIALQGTLEASNPAPSPELVKLAVETRGEVKAARHALEAAQAQQRLASREVVPSPLLGVGYSQEQESETTIIQGILSMELPLFDWNAGQRGVTAAQVRQAKAALAATERRVQQEVVVALTRLEMARAAAEGYAGNVSQAMLENMELVTESYRAGKIDFLQLVVIRQRALEARRESIDVLEELVAAEAELSLAVGRVD